MAYQDYSYSRLEDIPDSDVEQLLETPNSQDGVNITNEQYQDFHDDARDSEPMTYVQPHYLSHLCYY